MDSAVDVPLLLYVDPNVQGSATGVSYIMLLFIIPITFIIGQFFILRCKNKRLGMILPFIWFCASIVLTLYVAYNQNDEAIQLVLTFLALNIPTGIMLLMMYIKNGKEKEIPKSKNTPLL